MHADPVAGDPLLHMHVYEVHEVAVLDAAYCPALHVLHDKPVKESEPWYRPSGHVLQVNPVL